VTLPSVKNNFTERSVSHDKEKEKTDIRGEERYPDMGPPDRISGKGGTGLDFLNTIIELRLIPVDANDIMEMIREIKGFRVLSGPRDRTPKDIDTIANTLLHLAQKAQSFR